MPSYNHAAFIGEAINSVLSQSYASIELIIVDDGSIDNSVEVIKKFQDARIKLFVFEKNKGACEATNYGIQHASGDYIAILNSDDIWHADKLKLQFDIMSQNPKLGAVFSSARYVNEEGAPFKTKEKLNISNPFHQKNKSRGQWLKQFFMEGNCLCHPSVLIKKECYTTLGLYDNRFRQLPDFAMWVNVVKKYDIHVMENELLDFRILTGNRNASSATEKNIIRSANEFYFIGKDFFNGISIDDLKEGFSNYLVNKSFESEEEFEIEKAFLYFHPTSFIVWDEIHHMIGVEKMYDLLNNPSASKILSDNYQYNDKNFQENMAQINIFRGNLSVQAMFKLLWSRVKKKGWRYCISRLSKKLTPFPAQ